MATQAAKGSGAEVVDGGTVLNAGTLGTSPITNAVSLRDVAIDDKYGHGSQVKADGGTGDGAGTQAAYAGGTGGLAFFPVASSRTSADQGFVMRTVSSKINNTANTVLQVNGNDFAGIDRDSIHEHVDWTYNTGYSVASGAAFDMLAQPSTATHPGRTKAGDAGYKANMNADGAAKPTRAVPGELTYHFGALGKATTDEYKAKDVFEANSPSS